MSRLLPIAFIGFVMLGMPGAGEGVAWPSMAEDLDQRIGALGILVTIHVAGYFVASVANGEITRRLGTGPALVTSGLLASVALVTYAVTPSWGILLAAGVLLGLSGGIIDAGVNAHVALRYDSRVMGFLHASFGLGATLAPLLMTWLIAADSSRWRWGFGILAALQLGLTAAFWMTRDRWGGAAEPGDGPPHRGLHGIAGLLLGFALVSGIERGAGAWAFTFLTEDLAVADGPAGVLVSAFFACFTIGRILMGIAGDRISARGYLRLGSMATLTGLGLVWWSPAVAVTGLGLLVAGLGVAPIFPTLMVITPRIVGRQRAHDVVGYELGAATIGTAVVPGGIGLAVNGIGTGVIPVILVVCAVAQLLVSERFGSAVAGGR